MQINGSQAELYTFSQTGETGGTVSCYTMLSSLHFGVLEADSCWRHHQGAITEVGMLWIEGIGHLQPEILHTGNN